MRIGPFVVLIGLAACGGKGTDCPQQPFISQDTAPGADTAVEQDLIDADVTNDAGEDSGPSVDVVPTPDSADPCGEAPHPMGCPCFGNDDCTSGYCIEGASGGLCSEQCFEDCPDGWQCKGVQGFGADVVFLCVPDGGDLCNTCEDGSACVSGLCVDVGGQGRCSFGCGGVEDCPDGFACELEVPGAGEIAVCVPATADCDCLPKHAGKNRSCETVNDLGTCTGLQTCGPTGWSDCSAPEAVPEICDGLDNDCNAAVDDGLPETQPCENAVEGLGACEGNAVCVGIQGWICTAPTPQEESCNFLDDDCNGVIDDPYLVDGEYAAPGHCGTCFKSCEGLFPNATAGCDADKVPPQCVVLECDEGYFKLNAYQCMPEMAALCEPCSEDENCVLVDAKCVELDDGSYCASACDDDGDCPIGYSCAPVDDTTQCLPDSGSCSCTAAGLGLTKSCQATWPPAPVPGEPFITCYGTQVCEADGWGGCTLDAETCDGQDNDCNGVIDDPFVTNGKYATDENCGQCGNNCAAVPAPNGTGSCDTAPTIPTCTLTCDDGFFDINENPTDGCECQWMSATDLPGGLDENCDGVDGELGNSIFVAKNGDDGNSGDIEAPMLTIQAALAKAGAEGKRDVYVASGVYAESIELVSGVALYGGYSSDFKQRHIDLNVTVIMGQDFSQELPGAVNAYAISGAADTTRVDGFTIFGRNNTNPGGSSYGVYLFNCTQALTLSNNTIEAGVGGPGAKGSDGMNGAVGVNGGSGAGAFGVSTTNCNSITPNLPRPGGSGGDGACNGGPSGDGGDGGGNTCPPTYNAAPVAYENGAGGQGPGAGSGGTGGWDREVWYCYSFPPEGECHQATGGSEVGVAGTSGAQGTQGDTAGGNACAADDAAGTVQGGLWVGGVAPDGATGSHGSGGGGGGAGGGAQDGSQCSDRTHIGGTGGGGGSGGCGGTGGTGGASGGASFGLFLHWVTPPISLPTVADNVVYGGIGGPGGAGGNGGSGGPGGSGGAGGLDDFDDARCAATGGAGGDGGNGGHGEGGGGGCGGASFCLFVSGDGGADLNDYTMDNTFILGVGGPGGSGGPSIGNPGDDGAAGALGETNI